MSYNQRKSLRKKLDRITHKRDMRRKAKEINDTGIGGTGEIVNATVAHWAEQILQEHYGSSNYGFTVTTDRFQEKVILKDNNSPHRDNTYELRSAGELKRDYTQQVGFAEEGEIRHYKNVAVDWFETEAVRVADEALDQIHRIEEQRMMSEGY